MLMAMRLPCRVGAQDAAQCHKHSCARCTSFWDLSMNDMMTLLTLVHVHDLTAVSCISGKSAMKHNYSLQVCQSSIHMSAIWVTLQQLLQVHYHLANVCSILYGPSQHLHKGQERQGSWQQPGSTTASSGMLLIPAPPKPSRTCWTDSSKCMLCNIASFTCLSNIKHTMLRQTQPKIR